MKCIEILRKMDINELSAQTKISKKSLDEIFECKFDRINKTRAIGFVAILQRDMKVDMSQWLQAYNEFHVKDTLAAPINQESNVIIPPPQEKSPKPSNASWFAKWLILICIIIFAIAAYYAYSVYYEPDISQVESTQDSNIPLDSNQAVQENEIIVSEEISQSSEVIAQNMELKIIPKEPLWLGIIDVESGSKKQLSLISEYVIVLDSPKLIRTGHSYFSISINGEFREFIGGDNKYFSYTIENGFSEISKSEFLALNKGLEW